MEIKIITFITIFFYSVIASQSFSYIISLTNVQQNMSAAEYISFRKITDRNYRAKFKLVIYATLIFNLLLVIVTIINSSVSLFITAAIALTLLVADMMVTVKGNLPINDTINTWTTDNYPANWAEYRTKWLKFISQTAGTKPYRVCQPTGRRNFFRLRLSLFFLLKLGEPT